MFAESRDDEQIIERVAALDIGKAGDRAPHPAPRRGWRAAGAGGVHALDDGHVVV